MSTATPAKENAIIKTAYGDLTVAFWPDVAPKTVENFKKLARAGFYDGTAFHRIIKGFMVQGMPGTGGPGWQVKAEFNAKSHTRGVLSMARSSNPDSAGSQFFIVHGDAKFLDRQYTAFGEIVAGDDVLEKLANVPTKSGGGGEKSTPIERVGVESIKIVAAA
jgi:peptidyl-prolyl cis-trans isomerase B (cyclophilin B)